MKDIYYKFVNYIQEMPALWFGSICLLLVAISLGLIVKFYKIYNGTQKNFEKISLLVLAIIVFAVLVYLTYIRK